MEFKTIGKIGISLVERVFLQDFNKVDHKEVERALGFSCSTEPKYEKEDKNYQGQN